MNPLLSSKIVSVVLIVATATCCRSLANGADLASRNRHNLFDPIFGYDEIDSHTVSVAQPSGSNQQKRKLADSRLAPQPNQPRLFNDDDDLPSSRAPERKASPSTGIDMRRSAATSGSPSPSTPKPLATPSLVVSSSSSAWQEPKRTTRREVSEQPRHWSALENYYSKLRQSALSSVQQQQQLDNANNYQPIYQVIQQPEVDESLSAYRPLNAYSGGAPYSASGINALLANTQQSAAKPPAIILRLVDSRSPNSDPDFGFSVHHNSAPGISRPGGGVGLATILTTPQSDKIQPASPYDFQVKSVQPGFSQSSVGLTTSFGYPSTAAHYDDSARTSNLEWRKLPELLLLQQQQQRIKHQQETFGDWYDHQRSRELLQEETYCGPRNYLANLVAPKQIEEPSDYPSHMGVYINSTDADSNYLCAASWVHEQFALTLASCLRGSDIGKLVVRAGEWAAYNNTDGSSERSTALRQVAQVFVFPKYRSNSTDHDLALLKFTKPLDFLELNRLLPACQVQSRSLIRANSCWAPVRNMTVSEYFDADGEGETKERKSVKMVAMPVRLIANDNNECLKQTKLEYFNFQHPNYICSADFRGALWRSRLNQTDFFGSGIYCNEGGNLSLVSILHPIHSNSSSAYGFLDLSYYRPWMRNIISGRNY